MFPGIGFTEIILIGVLAIILFGKRLPEVARNAGKSYGELRKTLTDLQSSMRIEADEVSTPSIAAADEFADEIQEPSVPQLVPPPADD